MGVSDYIYNGLYDYSKIYFFGQNAKVRLMSLCAKLLYLNFACSAEQPETYARGCISYLLFLIVCTFHLTEKS